MIDATTIPLSAPNFKLELLKKAACVPKRRRRAKTARLRTMQQEYHMQNEDGIELSGELARHAKTSVLRWPGRQLGLLLDLCG